MSNRKRPDRNKTALDTITAAVGNQRLTGGCDACAAFQTMTKRDDGVFRVTVHHDDSCPWLNARTSR